LDAATLALAAAASAPMSRRAAAAAAWVTIANMVASENGTAYMPQMMPTTVPQPPPMTTSKEKKPKGLFKPPAFPSSILRPRTQVVAPIPSTAFDASNTDQPTHLFCSLSIAVAGRHSLSSVRSTVTTFKLSASRTLQIRFSTHQKQRLHFTLML
jgi:hypothetical protein